MTPFDWVLVAIVAYSTLLAFMRGIVRELFALGGLIGGILLAAWNYSRVAAALGRFITSPELAQTVAFVLILVIVAIAATLLGKSIHSTAHAIGLGFFDRLLGAAFGFVRGCLIGVVVLLAVAAFYPHSKWTENSRLSSYFLTGAHAVSFVVPYDLRQQVVDGAEMLKHKAPDWIKPLK
ncbi:colicin V production protein [Edaphobacter acidisoli]|uniref:Colicin V production protein n=1 Tax=Edaphobacter acidisoli TaxID=2040573 RepID=A0A916RMJ9_9BACT|nr:CvpA family protein [Edaphobacter acidisoli]GGA62835.1 colicin V production protein [Edaphobacter acidisoli]